MTQEQYDHWLDFSLRLASLPRKRRVPSREFVRESVEDFIQLLEEEGIGTIHSWDDPVGDHFDEWKHDGIPLSLMPKRLHQKWCAALDQDDLDRADNLLWDWRDGIANWISAPLRAALDIVAEPSAGVMGYTAGDLRRCYPEGIPDWITGGNSYRWYHGFSGEKLNGTFAEMPDEQRLLL